MANGFVEFTGPARLDKRTKHLVGRLSSNDVAIIDHLDLDRVSAEELVDSGVRVVVNVARSQSGRFPNPGPLLLVEGGVRLIDVSDGALVVARGPGHKRDLRIVRPYLRDFKPVLVGVDGGADALLQAGHRPDVIIGDMDSGSDAALRSNAEKVVHAYTDGDAPGRGRPRRALAARRLPARGPRGRRGGDRRVADAAAADQPARDTGQGPARPRLAAAVPKPRGNDGRGGRDDDDEGRAD